MKLASSSYYYQPLTDIEERERSDAVTSFTYDCQTRRGERDCRLNTITGGALDGPWNERYKATRASTFALVERTFDKLNKNGSACGPVRAL
jgi:hypothetical protein